MQDALGALLGGGKFLDALLGALLGGGKFLDALLGALLGGGKFLDALLGALLGGGKFLNALLGALLGGGKRKGSSLQPVYVLFCVPLSDGEVGYGCSQRVKFLATYSVLGAHILLQRLDKFQHRYLQISWHLLDNCCVRHAYPMSWPTTIAPCPPDMILPPLGAYAKRQCRFTLLTPL